MSPLPRPTKARGAAAPARLPHRWPLADLMSGGTEIYPGSVIKHFERLQAATESHMSRCCFLMTVLMANTAIASRCRNWASSPPTAPTGSPLRSGNRLSHALPSTRCGTADGSRITNGRPSPRPPRHARAAAVHPARPSRLGAGAHRQVHGGQTVWLRPARRLG